MRTVIEVLVSEMQQYGKCQEAIVERLKELTPDTTAFCELPKLAASNSAPTGARVIGTDKKSNDANQKQEKAKNDLSTVLSQFIGISMKE